MAVQFNTIMRSIAIGAIKGVKFCEHVVDLAATPAGVVFVVVSVIFVVMAWTGFEIGTANIFEFGAKKWVTSDNQSAGASQNKTESADAHSIFSWKPKLIKPKMEVFGKNQKILKELFFFNLGSAVPAKNRWSALPAKNQLDDEEAKICEIFSAISRSKIGNAGYDVKKSDVIKARRVHIWPNTLPHGPIVIEFTDEAVNQIRKVLKEAGKKLDFEFGAFFCEISCQNSAGNRWPRLRHKLMERLRCSLAVSSEEKINKLSADRPLPFPQIQIETVPANMPSERRRLARANSSNPRALRVIDVSDPDYPDPTQAPVLSSPVVSSSVVSSSTVAVPPSPRRNRLSRSERNNRRRHNTRQVHLDNIARAQRFRSNQVQEIDSSASSTDSVVFTGSVPGGATSTPVQQNDPDPNAADQSHQSNHSTDYYTAPETPGSTGAAGEADVDEDVVDVTDVEEDDDGVPDLEAIELEIANENMAKVDCEGATGDASVPDADTDAVDGHAADAVDAERATAGPSRTAAVGVECFFTPEGMPPPEDVITIGTSSEGDGDGDTDYLASVSPTKIPPRPQVVLPMVVENDVITLEDSSDLDSDESWVDRSPSSTSSDDDRQAEISRQELRELELRELYGDDSFDQEAEIPEEVLLEIERSLYDAGETPSTSEGEEGDEDGNESGPIGPDEPTHPPTPAAVKWTAELTSFSWSQQWSLTMASLKVSISRQIGLLTTKEP